MVQNQILLECKKISFCEDQVFFNPLFVNSLLWLGRVAFSSFITSWICVWEYEGHDCLCMNLLLYQQLYKGAGEDVIQLFDLSTMPKGRSSEDHHSACPSLPSLINKGRRETLFSLGTLLYRVAHRLSLSKVYIFFGTTIWL